MKKIFSKFWKSSKQPRKQRKYLHNLPSHLRKKLVSTNLSKELKKTHGKRNIPLKKGDKVKVMRGQFKGKIGEVTNIDLKKVKVNVQDVELLKKDGNKVSYPLSPSNLMITEMKLDDKKRKKLLERK